MTPNRTGRGRSIPAQFKVAVDQMPHPVFVLDDHDQIDAFDADLQSPASAGNGKERRSAPTVLCAAGGDAAAIFCAEDKAALEHVGHNGNAPCMFKHFLGNASIGGRHDFMQDAAGMIEAVVGCFAIGSCPGDAGHTEYCHDCHKFLHTFHLFYLCAASPSLRVNESH